MLSKEKPILDKSEYKQRKEVDEAAKDTNKNVPKPNL
jgi:hypothetical protein